MSVDELMREVLRCISDNARAEELKARQKALLESFSPADLEKWDAFSCKLARTIASPAFNPSTQAELNSSLESAFPGMLRDGLDDANERIKRLEEIIVSRLGPGAVPTTSIHSGRPLYDDSKERP